MQLIVNLLKSWKKRNGVRVNSAWKNGLFTKFQHLLQFFKFLFLFCKKIDLIFYFFFYFKECSFISEYALNSIMKVAKYFKFALIIVKKVNIIF